MLQSRLKLPGYLFLLLIAAIPANGICLALSASLPETLNLAGGKISAKLDPRYKNYHILADQIPEPGPLKQAVQEFGPRFPKTGLYIHQAPGSNLDIKAAKELGFSFAEYDREKDQILWLLDNDRGITHIGSSVTGAGVIVQNREGKILLILNPDINKWALPGGGTDRGELIRTGAARELKEEVGLETDPDNLKLIMITNSTDTMGRKGLNSVNHFFLTTRFSGVAKTTTEAPEIVWAHPSELKGRSIYKGKELHPLAPVLINAIENPSYAGYKPVINGKHTVHITTIPH